MKKVVCDFYVVPCKYLMWYVLCCKCDSLLCITNLLFNYESVNQPLK